MKRAALLTLMLLLFFATTALAETAIHQVKKGEHLSLIGYRYGVSWEKIAKDNKIQAPKYVIYLGQKLIINAEPWVWRNYGADPYGKRDPIKAIKSFKKLPERVKYLLSQKVQNNDWKWAKLANGDKREEMVCGGGVVKGKDAGLVVGGENKQQSLATKRYAVEFQNKKYILDDPLICHNWTWGVQTLLSKTMFEFPAIPLFKAKTKDFPPVPAFGEKEETAFPSVPIFSAVEEKEKGIAACGFDLYIGGGVYESDHYNHEGWYFWGKARYRPFEFNLTGTINACLGAFAFGALGGGDDNNYDYSWRKWAIGTSLKLIGRRWDSDFDLGLGRLYSDGEDGLYRSKQTDNIFLFSSHLNLYGRRDDGKVWFPKTELNLELTLPYDKSHNHSWDNQRLDSNPYNNKTLELTLNQSIYDYKINNHLLLTPGINLGFIKEFGRNNPNFLQFGPRMTMAWHNEDIVSISFLNYKENLEGNGDQWHWISGHLSISGLIKAYSASRISKATAEDLVF